MRQYLVVVRAGPNSFHRRLIAEDPARNWDCWVNWYAEGAPEDVAERYVLGGINKFEGLEQLLARWEGPFPYRYVLSLDDDVDFAPGGISRLFAVCDRNDLFLVQPSLGWDSFYSHDITLRNPACLRRRVSFIEVMAPCFSAAALELLRPTFLLTRSTWGIDLAWTVRCGDTHPMHVVDEVRAVHTKPIERNSGAFYRMLRASGVDPQAELAEVLKQLPPGRFRAANRAAGHAFRPGIPRAVAPLAMWFFEHMKWLAKVNQSVRRKLRRRAARRAAAGAG